MINIISFDGISLNDENYLSYPVNIKSPPSATHKFIEQAQADSQYSGRFAVDVRSLPINVIIKDQTKFLEKGSDLKEILRPGKRGDLVVNFSDDNRNYVINCVIQSITKDTKFLNLYTVILQSGQSAFITSDEFTEDWEVTASGDEKTLSVFGHSPTRLSLSITATTLPVNGWAYQDRFKLVGNVDYPCGYGPYCVTIDTASLVTANKMRSDCQDIMWMINGIAQKRWISDPNTDHTKVWFNAIISKGQQLTLKKPIESTGSVDYMEWVHTDDNLRALKALPETFIIFHGTEWIEVTAKNYKKFRTDVVTRGAFDTTLQAHVFGDVFTWIENPGNMLYGNSSATDPSENDSTYDDDKPLFDLSLSDNDEWVYTDSTQFYDSVHPNRTGGWAASVSRIGDQSDTYDYTENAESGDPAMGMFMATWIKRGKASSETAKLAWSLTRGCLISSVSMTGQKYRSATYWPGTKAIQLQRTRDFKNYYMVWYEATPTAANSWEAITKASQAVTPNMATVQFVFTGSLSKQLDIETYFEVLTATVEFPSANLPSFDFSTEAENYLLDITIENQTTGDSANLLYPMRVDVPLVVDGENYEITYGDANALSALELNDEGRDIWIRLLPGDNDLIITGNDIAILDVTLNWKERRL
jgi:hypothetical protein